MKRLLIVSIAFCAALVSCEGTKSIKSFSGVDSLSYAFGIDIASQIRGVQDSSLNAAVIAAAIKDVFADKAVMTRDDAYAFLNEWFSVREPAKQQAEEKQGMDSRSELSLLTVLGSSLSVNGLALTAKISSPSPLISIPSKPKSLAIE